MRQEKIKNLSQLLLAVYAMVCVLITFLAPEVVKIMATDEYYSAIYIMPAISAAIFQNAISNMYANVLLYHKKVVVYPNLFSYSCNCEYRA